MKTLAALLIAAAALRAAPPLDEGYHQMYNLQFNEAHRTFAEYSRQSPADPMGPVSEAAAYLFAEFDRLRILQSQFLTSNESFLDFHRPEADPVIKKQFEAKLDEAERLDDAARKKDPNDSNALFAEMLRLGLHSNYLAMIEKKIWRRYRM